jgi:uncharacterized protein
MNFIDIFAEITQDVDQDFDQNSVMLVEFKLTNYRSFRETQVLSMVAGSAKEHLPTHTSDSGINDLGRILRSAVVYGPNAAGKTNLLRAIQFMQSLVVGSATTSPTAQTPHDPFKLASLTREAPSDFEVTFIQQGIRYEYGFSVGPVRILREWLIEYPRGRGRKMFERSYDEKSQQYEWHFSSFFKGNRSVWREATRDNALFLSTAIQLNNQQLKPVFDWFQRRLVAVVGTTSMNALLTLKLLDQPDGKARLLPFLREADSGIADVEIQREPLPAGRHMFNVAGAMLEPPSPTAPPNIVKISFSHWTSETKESVKIDISDESNGTQILFRSAGAWLNVFSNGEVLLFDEIDTSLHPLLTRFLIEQFHSDSTNPNGAQLIFSTHNTSLLSQKLFRRDQIWFVEKEREGATRLFPLIEFSPRNDEAIERWYLRGRYGALPILNDLPR